MRRLPRGGGVEQKVEQPHSQETGAEAQTGHQYELFEARFRVSLSAREIWLQTLQPHDVTARPSPGRIKRRLTKDPSTRDAASRNVDRNGPKCSSTYLQPDSVGTEVWKYLHLPHRQCVWIVPAQLRRCFYLFYFFFFYMKRQHV